MRENDKLIRKVILSNPLYKISKDGAVLTRLSLKGSLLPEGKWRRADILVSDGYKAINVSVRKGTEKVRRRLKAHRIVYEKYNGKLDHTMVVNHKDGVKVNNRPSNLEMITFEENNSHAFTALGQSPIKNAKINFSIANRIRILYKKGMTYKTLAKKFKVSESNVSAIVTRKTWVKK